ncbi:MAG: hypothetical protein IBX48_09170 [Thiomicrospira sp.]|uniref:YaaC family protein n=1 Tax=Thiomicrospira sp. TaxID=935 RepID=UPI0019DBCDBC|nr:YaaC family protein [Thiomicrospira sp.]MBE0494494.1 hypothetical protein [Thiomicrospira sp.]
MSSVIQLNGKNLCIQKGIKQVDFKASSVITDDVWSFIELWLKRNKCNSALSCWVQSRRFYEQAADSPIEVMPLPLYYSFLNATKALLESSKVAKYASTHGVSGGRDLSAKAVLANEMVTFKTDGVLAALCRYLGEGSLVEAYRLKDLLWNIPFIHRAFNHTYTSSQELFIPLKTPTYVRHESTREAWIEAVVHPNFADSRKLKSLPKSIELQLNDKAWIVRRRKRFNWFKGKTTKLQKDAALVRLCNYHSANRRIFAHISGVNDLWYLKKDLPTNSLTERHLLTLMFAGMHRFSELARYDSAGLERLLATDGNWLISEFIKGAPFQFIDQIASEITGLKIVQPRIRS